MALQNWDMKDATRVIHRLGAPLSESTVRNNYYYAKNGQEGGPAVLTEEQISELNRLLWEDVVK